MFFKKKKSNSDSTDLNVKSKNGKKRFSLKQKILISLAGVLVFFIVLLGAAYLYISNKISVNTTSAGSSTSTSVSTSTEPLYTEQQGITNILLIGTDGRSLDEAARSDTMMICTLDNNTKKIKLTSLMRDSYVEIPGHKSQKLNAAYAYGGPDLLLKTIELNFKIKLDKYIVVNFWGLESIIDAVGGFDIDVKDYEISEINKYIGEVNAVKSPKLTKSGMQHLDGQQALSYARIRKVGNGEYERTERQRLVLTLFAQKLQAMNVFQYTALAPKLLDCVKTNVPLGTMLNYAYTVTKFKPLNVQSLQIPVDQISWGGIYNGAWVLLMDRNQNAQVMNDFIFKDTQLDTKSLDLASFRSVLSKYKYSETDTSGSVKDDDADRYSSTSKSSSTTKKSSASTSSKTSSSTSKSSSTVTSSSSKSSASSSISSSSSTSSSSSSTVSETISETVKTLPAQ